MSTQDRDAISGSGTIRFAELEVCRETRELIGSDKRIRLQAKPFRILEALLERPGELVTREELFARLWPTGTFVDFESGLNTAVNRLRTALGDSAEAPRYIETLPRLGYRFVCPVEGNDATAEEIAASPEIPRAAYVVGAAPIERAPSAARHWPRWMLAAGVIAGLAIAVLLWYWVTTPASAAVALDLQGPHSHHLITTTAAPSTASCFTASRASFT